MSASTNRRIVASKKGPPAVLALIEEPRPVPGLGEVLIRVAAAGVAWADVMMREGIYPGTTFPLTPGYDVAGTVAEVGSGVSGFAAGDPVASLTVRGGYASYVAVPAKYVAAIPAGLDPAEAVSLVLNYVTAYQMLGVANVVAGDTILVHGAAGGVGTALLQLAKLRSIDVIGTASKGKQDAVRALGAQAVDYGNEDFVQRARAASGVHAVFDAVGGPHWKRSFAALRHSGTLVAYGASTALRGGRLDLLRGLQLLVSSPRYAPIDLVGNSKVVAGYNIGEWRDARPARFNADLATLCALLAKRDIVPVVAQRLDLREAARAHELLGDAKVTGKIVLLP